MIINAIAAGSEKKRMKFGAAASATAGSSSSFAMSFTVPTGFRLAGVSILYTGTDITSNAKNTHILALEAMDPESVPDGENCGVYATFPYTGHVFTALGKSAIGWSLTTSGTTASLTLSLVGLSVVFDTENAYSVAPLFAEN